MSTRQLRELRDRLDQERAGCPLDRTAAGSAGRADRLRRSEQARRVWLEAKDTPLRLQQQAVARELAWRGRADAAALAAARPGWLEAILGPLPDHQEGRIAWQQAAVAVDGYWRLWGLADAGPAQHPAPRAERAAAGGAADRRGRVGPAAALLGREPRGDLGQRRDWRAAHAALQRLDRAREERPEREDRIRRVGRDRDDERAIS